MMLGALLGGDEEYLTETFDKMFADILLLDLEEYIDICENKMTEQELEEAILSLMDPEGVTFSAKKRSVELFNKYRHEKRIDRRRRA